MFVLSTLRRLGTGLEANSYFSNKIMLDMVDLFWHELPNSWSCLPSLPTTHIFILLKMVKLLLVCDVQDKVLQLPCNQEEGVE